MSFKKYLENIDFDVKIVKHEFISESSFYQVFFDTKHGKDVIRWDFSASDRGRFQEKDSINNENRQIIISVENKSLYLDKKLIRDQKNMFIDAFNKYQSKIDNEEKEKEKSKLETQRPKSYKYLMDIQKILTLEEYKHIYQVLSDIFVDIVRDQRRISLETALQFKLFSRLTEDLNEEETKKFLIQFNQELEENYGLGREQINLILNNYNKIEFTNENVFNIIDFLAYVDYVYLEKIVDFVVSIYMFEQEKFFKELSNCRVVIEFICNKTNEYINDGILRFNTAMKLIEFYDCNALYENDLWLLTEIRPSVFSLTLMIYYKKIEIPLNVERIKLKVRFNFPLKFPTTVKALDLINYYGEFREGLEELIIHEEIKYNCKLPSTLKKFKAGDNFNQCIVFHEGIEEIELGYYFDQEVKIPSTVKTLISHSKHKFNIEFAEGINIQTIEGEYVEKQYAEFLMKKSFKMNLVN